MSQTKEKLYNVWCQPFESNDWILYGYALTRVQADDFVDYLLECKWHTMLEDMN